MIKNCTGVILAGGINRRFPGKKKTFRKVGKQAILTTIHSVFTSLFEEIIIVVNDPQDFCEWDMHVVTDIHPSRCALAGLHAGLFYSSNPYAYVTACDTPFLKPQIIRYLIDQVEPGMDVIIPRTDDGLEPLSAVYSKECVPLIEEKLNDNVFMIKKFFRRKRVKEISSDRLKKMDPEMRFIFNINTEADLNTANQMMQNQMGQKGRNE